MDMKKYFYGLLFMMILSFMIGTNMVFAEEDTTCNAVSLNELRTMAANVKVSYVPTTIDEKVEMDEESGSDILTTYYLDVKVYNITSKLYVKTEASGSNVTSSEHLLSLLNVGADGAATIRQRALNQPVTYTFTIFSDEYGCTGRILRTMKLTLPRFNYYSELAICQDIPDYYLCQQYTTYEVDGATFYDKVDEYKAKLEAQNEELANSEDNTGFVNKAISSISKYKYVVVGVIVVIGVVATTLILRKNKKKKEKGL